MIIGDRAEWYLDLDLVRHSSEAWVAFVPSVSIKDRPLHWILVRSQTYYPEHILIYGSRKGSLLSCHGFRLFLDRLIGGGDGGGLSTTLSPGLRCGGLESKFGRGPGPLDRRVVGWVLLVPGVQAGRVFQGTQLGYTGSQIAV